MLKKNKFVYMEYIFKNIAVEEGTNKDVDNIWVELWRYPADYVELQLDISVPINNLHILMATTATSTYTSLETPEIKTTTTVEERITMTKKALFFYKQFQQFYFY